MQWLPAQHGRASERRDREKIHGQNASRLMGTKAESRFAFISEKAEFASDDLLDV